MDREPLPEPTDAAPRQAPAVTLDRVIRRFGATAAVDAISAELPAGEMTVLLGPSGCGKSTLLRLIAGLELPDDGRILIGGRDMATAPVSQRDIAMVFQNYALFPHLTVAENITFGLTLRRTPRAERAERLTRVARMMGLEPLLARKPAQLSGGQQQRVALARAVISERPVCLMDEPLSNLDAKLRAEMRSEIRALQRRLGLTMVYVTHDQVEAMTMADRIVLLNGGRIEQTGSPAEIYERPETTFAARFIGTPPMNLLPGADLGLGGADAGRIIGLRPEDVRLAAGGLPVRMTAQEYLGADLLVTCAAGGSTLVLRLPARTPLPGDGALHIGWAEAALHRFDAASGRRLDAAERTPVTA